MGDNMKTIIKKIIEKKSLAAIYTNKKDSEKFTVAIVLYSDGEFIFCKCYDDSGDFDGYEIKRIDDIFLIELQGEYLEALSIKNDTEFFEYEKYKDCIELLRDIVVCNNYCISVELINSGKLDVRGGILSIESDYISCQTYRNDGQKDAISFFLLRDISCMTIHSQEDIEMEKIIADIEIHM